jgi:hypothetical protein
VGEPTHPCRRTPAERGRRRLSPTLLLGAVLALVGAQVTRVAVPRRLGYPTVLGLAVAGVLLAELASQWAHAGGPALGALHPLADLAGIALLEGARALLHGPADRGQHRAPQDRGRHRAA